MSCEDCKDKICYTEEQDDKRWSEAVAIGHANGVEATDKLYATPIESMQLVIRRLKESNALICELVKPHLKDDVVAKIEKHAYKSR
jgi:hypothetical protein